ncbi:MAG: hypothetical protein QOK37_4128 [Thermoanaerobaculia bacterium]|jgi:hypothetical protein|nr:hypothetical protein [Thermoanaerobaculia bacterium]
MGIALWIGCAAAVLLSARGVRYGRPARWVGELILVLTSAAIFGMAATALDFGGWNEPDWRAGLFVFFGSAAVIAVNRLAALMRQSGPRAGVASNNKFTASAPTPHSPQPNPQKQQ